MTKTKEELQEIYDDFGRGKLFPLARPLGFDPLNDEHINMSDEELIDFILENQGGGDEKPKKGGKKSGKKGKKPDVGKKLSEDDSKDEKPAKPKKSTKKSDDSGDSPADVLFEIIEEQGKQIKALQKTVDKSTEKLDEVLGQVGAIHELADALYTDTGNAFFGLARINHDKDTLEAYQFPFMELIKDEAPEED
jgi:hypothetical protein